jgi:hypothetical protein
MTVVDPLGSDLDENYERFLAEAEATGCVWGLEGPDGWALCQSNLNDELSVMPLWSQPEYAQVHCADEWASFKVTPISLEELLDDWLVGMHEDLTLVGPNWNEDMEGDEIEPLDLLAEFEDVDDS